jgi:hypothetical protein
MSSAARASVASSRVRARSSTVSSSFSFIEEVVVVVVAFLAAILPVVAPSGFFGAEVEGALDELLVVLLKGFLMPLGAAIGGASSSNLEDPLDATASLLSCFAAEVEGFLAPVDAFTPTAEVESLLLAADTVPSIAACIFLYTLGKDCSRPINTL